MLYRSLIFMEMLFCKETQFYCYLTEQEERNSKKNLNIKISK